MKQKSRSVTEEQEAKTARRRATRVRLFINQCDAQMTVACDRIERGLSATVHVAFRAEKSGV